MKVAQAILNLALLAKPSWNGTGTNVIDTATLTDSVLSRSGEVFTGGTLWIPGSTLRVYTVKSHSTQTVILDTVIPEINPADPPPNPLPTSQQISYIISKIPLSELMQVVNSVLATEWDMTSRDIDVDTDGPSDYYLVDEESGEWAQDIRRVELIDEDDVVTRNHYWREEKDQLHFYSTPPTEGTIRIHYPIPAALVFSVSTELPRLLRMERFVNNCLQVYYRSGIQKMGKDGPVNYDLINEAKDAAKNVSMRGLTSATALMEYDPRFRA